MEAAPRPRLRRRLGALATLTATLAGIGGLTAGAAHADPLPRPPSDSCNPNLETVWQDVATVRVSPAITHWTGISIAPGTTGSATETLSEVDSVSTTYNTSVEITAQASILFAKVSAKVGFSVQKTKASTSSWSRTVTMNFNRPGEYGLFKGTHRVEGEFVRYQCARTGPSTGVWVNTMPGGTGSYVTFDVEIQGTIACDSPVAPGSVQELARRALSCP
ncbi:hypothetical protein ACFC58_40425 [Kitasatospora purpeofusca]|uniref:hypothetical protein n=1 Tax=Kitasatospora purpeofusca TaxID=67352 RepID=UPI0035D81374